MKTTREINVQHDSWEIEPLAGDHLPQVITMYFNDTIIVYKRLNDVS